MQYQILVLLWKNLLMRRNHYIATALEILLPIGLIILANIILPKHSIEIDKDPIVFEEFKGDRCLSVHSNFEIVIYEPSTPFTDLLMSKAACFAGYRKSSVKSRKINDNSSYFSIGVKFEDGSNGNTIPDILNYTLYPTDKIWVNLVGLWRHSGFTIPRYSISSLFKILEFQRAMDASYLYLKNITAPKLSLQNTDLFGRTPRLFSIAIYTALFLAFSLMVPPIVSRIVEEKYTGAKELMLMMGVVRWQLWVAKFLDVILFLSLVVTVMVIFLYAPLKEDSNTLVIPPFILWCVIMYGLVGVTVFLFFLTSFFDTASLAVFVTETIWSFSFIFNNFVFNYFELPRLIKYLLCLFPHITLMNGISILLDFDFYEKAVNITERLSGKDDYLPLQTILLIMSFNIVLYVLLTWYLEEVNPGKFGVPQPYNFCFKKSYWSPKKVNAMYCNNCCDNKVLETYEPVPSDLQIGVSLQNVCKIYKSADKGSINAVNDVNINFYKGEISALLGHNGAGKTTVFAMITGLSYPTSGRIIINGYDIGINICRARCNLGLCPQQDMLFNDLTTIQILKFYGVVKGLTLLRAKIEARCLISKLKLDSVKNTQTSSLSGGQKRKVSLAIALIGGSEVLVLDEPTSGMDPEIRREIWEILLGFRGSRTILLTTHFMEEADALCDRIAIMDHGRIKCYGSPLFLKSKHGKGYVLSIVVVDSDKVQELTEYIKQFIPTAKFKSQNIRTLTYELPEKEVDVFPALFSGLDEKQANNEITSYGISLATIEDVFLRLRSGNKANENEDTPDSSHYKKLEIEDEYFDVPKISGYLLYLYQLWTLMIKKYYLFQRTYKSFIIYTLIPSLIVVIMVVFSQKAGKPKPIPDLSSSKPLIYSADLYSPFLVLYSNHTNEPSPIFDNFITRLGCTVQEVTNTDVAIRYIYDSDFYKYARSLNLVFDFFPERIDVQHNNEAVHMVPVALNIIHNLLLKLHGANSEIVTSVNIRHANKEIYIPPRATVSCVIDEIPDFSGIQTMYYLLGPTKEKFYGAKEIQLMITPTTVYWLSHLLCDLISFAIYMIIICLGIGFSLGNDLIIQNIDEILPSLLLWGAGLILIAYFISTLVKNVAAAFSVNLIIYILFTFVVYNIIGFEGLPNFFQYLHPTCILKFGFADLCSGKENNYIMALFLYDVVLFCLLLFKDSEYLNVIFHSILNKFIKINYSLKHPKDEYVENEEQLVKSIIRKEHPSTAALIVDELRRWYMKNLKPLPVVKGISFTVNEGECFGLLGVNGAGKTTTFKMLIGAIPPSCGSTYISSKKLSFWNRDKCLFTIGYCPQFGGLIPIFKGTEILKLFARLRGLRSSQANIEVRKWLNKLDLYDFASQKCGTYSGGNQRKLSTAISLIGNCPLVFLDEPTSGVDPVSRRSIWSVIGEIQKEGQSVVLTSHSMDECEALCSRLAIMVSGSFRCIGETTTLKDRFGQGYCVQLKITNGASEENIYSLKSTVMKYFQPGCELVDEHLTVLQYHVTNKSISWASLFKKLKTLKENFDLLESYTATATTLEQVFIYFARNQ